MGRYLIDQQLTLLWYTQDSDGNDQNCDSTPVVTVTGPGVSEATVTTTNPSTGVYSSTYTATEAGRYTFTFTGVLDTAPEIAHQTRVVHDGLAEGQGQAFPDGVGSWVSAVF